MKIEEANNRIKSLKEKLKKWSYEYYHLDSPTIDDHIFDEHIKELDELEKKFPNFLTEDSPTQKVGGGPSKNFEKSRHLTKPMLSLKNAFNHGDLLHFDKQVKDYLKTSENIEYNIEPKIDGLSISLHYQNGELVKSLTRGDGIIGEVVTRNIRQISSIPQKITLSDKLEIRGEVFMPLSRFEEINNERTLNNQQIFANPRNAASGTIRQIDFNIVKKRKLDMFVYNATSIETKKDFWSSQSQTLDNLASVGFNTSSLNTTASSIQEAILKIEEISKERNNLDYEIDGIVLKINNTKHHELIGSTYKFPRWAIAFKFPAEVRETKLLDIFPTVGRTGRITYNALLEPINLIGSTVQRATLHNAEYIRNLDLRIGDTVGVKKAGEIIPKVIYSLKNKRENPGKWQEITNCPECNSLLIKNTLEVDQYCNNVKCNARIIQSLIHFCSKSGMNIEGLAEKQITNFFKIGLIKKVQDIYKLKNKRKEILKLEGYKEKSINNLLRSIENSKTRNLDKLLFSFGIRHIGQKTSLELAKAFKDLSIFFGLDFQNLKLEKDLGVVKSTSLIEWFKNEVNKELIYDLSNIGVNIKYIETEPKEKNRFTDKKIAVTGTILGGTREQIKEKLIGFGANVVSDVSNSTNFLIVGDKPSKRKINKIDKSKIINVINISDIK